MGQSILVERTIPFSPYFEKIHAPYIHSSTIYNKQDMEAI